MLWNVLTNVCLSRPYFHKQESFRVLCSIFYFKSVCRLVCKAFYSYLLSSSNYLRTWCAYDLVSTLPVAYILLTWQVSSRHLLLAHILPLLRIAKLYTVASNLATFVKVSLRLLHVDQIADRLREKYF